MDEGAGDLEGRDPIQGIQEGARVRLRQVQRPIPRMKRPGLFRVWALAFKVGGVWLGEGGGLTVQGCGEQIIVKLRDLPPPPPTQEW